MTIKSIEETGPLSSSIDGLSPNDSSNDDSDSSENSSLSHNSSFSSSSNSDSDEEEEEEGEESSTNGSGQSKTFDDNFFNSWSKIRPLLPPLPEPRHKTKRQQAYFGCILVGALISIIVTVTSCAVLLGDFPSPWKWIMVGITYALAAVAIWSLISILTQDPGIIYRSKQNCFPLPNVVKSRILECNEEGKPITLEGLGNIRGTNGNDIYCIRCCVWRRFNSNNPRASGKNKKGTRPHHCSICERCVNKLDHHCGVFGRCIAGNGFFDAWEEKKIGDGTMIYFQLILAVGAFSGFLAVVLIIVSLSLNVVWWAGIVLLGCVLVYCCLGALLHRRVFC